MKIALVHDYLKEYGGAERVLEVMHEMWPDAPLYTSFIDWPSFAKAPAGKADIFKSWEIRTSWVQKYPFIQRWISPLRFLAPKIWGSFNLSEYDVVISSSGWFMCRGVALRGTRVADKNVDPSVGAEVGEFAGPASRVSHQHPRPSQNKFGVLSTLLTTRLPFIRSQKLWEACVRDIRVDGNPSLLSPAHRNRALHICYIHHPPRNLYGYATGSDLQKYWIVRVYAAIVNFFLRQYDFDSAQAVDYFVANSNETARRVEKFYRRDSVVVYPPIEIQATGDKRLETRKVKSNSLETQSPGYFLSVGRLTYAKRVDLAIAVCNTLKLPLKIVGTGKEEEYLRSIAGSTVEFLGGVSDEELGKLYANARALIFSALDEDFGMVPVEAMAHGTPVVGLAQGGVKETVVDGETGVLFNEATALSLTRAMKRYMGMKKEWSISCQAHAKKFSKERFKKELKEYVRDMYNKAQVEARV